MADLDDRKQIARFRLKATSCAQIASAVTRVCAWPHPQRERSRSLVSFTESLNDLAAE